MVDISIVAVTLYPNYNEAMQRFHLRHYFQRLVWPHAAIIQLYDDELHSFMSTWQSTPLSAVEWVPSKPLLFIRGD